VSGCFICLVGGGDGGVGSTRLQEGINPAQGVFIEMFVTSYLVLAVLMLAVEKHHVTPFAPVSPHH